MPHTGQHTFNRRQMGKTCRTSKYSLSYKIPSMTLSHPLITQDSSSRVKWRLTFGFCRLYLSALMGSAYQSTPVATAAATVPDLSLANSRKRPASVAFPSPDITRKSARPNLASSPHQHRQETSLLERWTEAFTSVKFLLLDTACCMSCYMFTSLCNSSSSRFDASDVFSSHCQSATSYFLRIFLRLCIVFCDIRQYGKFICSTELYYFFRFPKLFIFSQAVFSQTFTAIKYCSDVPDSDSQPTREKDFQNQTYLF